MLIVYGGADCHGHATQLLYQERYPNRRVPYHTTFTSVSRRLRENGSGVFCTPQQQENPPRIIKKNVQDPIFSVAAHFRSLNLQA
ncbi:hypothetical protein TNCV_721161 [Trichonephila clavipes]|nr:hypothetical protein TNCV_721161 [Trichonephila clavipes]